MEMANKKENWVYDIENRLQSRKLTLGHERGAGAKCFHCKDQCPGLELHFWRKICKSCKCGIELHDVAEDEDLRFHILFKDRPQSSKYLAAKAILEYKIKEKQSKFTEKDEPIKPVVFDWVPPEASPSLAIDYMNHLPEDKVPISGTPGAEYRRIQLNKQLPLHDLMLSAKDASTMREEEPEYKLWMEMLRKGAGIGKILRVKQTQFLGQSEEFKTQNPQKSANMQKRNDMQSLNAGFRNLNMQPNFPAPKVFRPIHPVASYVEASTKTEMPSIPETIPGLRLPSSFLPARQQLLQQQQQQQQQINNNVEPSLDDINTSASLTDNENSNETLDISAIYPLAQTPPNRTDKSDTTQLLGPPGKENHPNPPSRLASNMDLTIAPNKDMYVANSNEENANIEMVGASVPTDPAENHLVPQAMVCTECNKPINFNTVAIFAEKAGSNKAWHPQCFVCAVCKEMLVDLVYFYYGKNLLCGRHYAEKRNICRCAACDELIFVSNWTMSGDNQSYHLEHFCCAECDLELAGHKYVLNAKNKNLPTCMDCYGKLYAKKCLTCGQPVTPEQQGICLKEFDWHATPDCFKCSNKNCNKCLVNQRFVMIDSLPFCSKECTVDTR